MPVAKKAKSKNRIKVGDRVYVLFGISWVPAVVMGDFGYIGVGGRRLLSVRQTAPEADYLGPYDVREENVRKRWPPAARRSPTVRGSTVKVGDRVYVPFGTGWAPATVIEDRGNLGVGGRRLLRVQQIVPADEEMEPYEVPEEHVRKRRPTNGRQQAAAPRR